MPEVEERCAGFLESLRFAHERIRHRFRALSPELRPHGNAGMDDRSNHAGRSGGCVDLDQIRSAFLQQACRRARGRVIALLQRANWNVAADQRARYAAPHGPAQDRKSTRLNSSHVSISYAVFCSKKKINNHTIALSKLYESQK